MTASPTPPERRSECPVCPPWVVWCAHFASRILILSDGISNPAGCARHKRWRLLPAVGEGTGFMPRRTGCGCIGFNEDIWITLPTLSDAEAEFRRREAALLGREA